MNKTQFLTSRNFIGAIIILKEILIIMINTFAFLFTLKEGYTCKTSSDTLKYPYGEDRTNTIFPTLQRR